jgi:hypothetical protein
MKYKYNKYTYLHMKQQLKSLVKSFMSDENRGCL